jgi:hypothetical protein
MDATLLVLYVLASFLALKSLVSLMASHKRRYLLERMAQENIAPANPTIAATPETASADVAEETAA